MPIARKTKEREKVETPDNQVFDPPNNSHIESMARKTDENSLYLPVTTLPSKFIPYPKDVKISYRRYGWMEVKYLSQAEGVISDDDKLQMAMEGIHVEGMDKYDLTGPDFLYIELLRKISTTNPPYFEVAYPCPKCGMTCILTVRINELVFEDLDVPALPAVAHLSCGEMSFSPITVRGQESLRNVDIPQIYQSSAFMAAQCTSHTYEEAYKIITEQCDAKDIQVLEHIDTLFDHGLRSVKHVCTNRIPSYKVVDGINYGEIMTMFQRRGEEDHKKILELMKEKGFTPVNSQALSEADVKIFLEELGCVSYEVCNHETSLALDGGEGFVLPFRFTRADVINAVTFGN